MHVKGVGGWMTDEYIKRSDAIKAVDNPCHVYFPENKAKLESIPAEDVAPVVHGKWVSPPKREENVGYRNGYGIYYECSRCGFIEDCHTNFCPYCGARMDGEI